MNQKRANKCTGGPNLIFACSGAADVGEISDRAARNMSRDGVGKMFCLAGIGGRVPDIMKMTGTASNILAIDGCKLDCVKSCLQQAGFDQFEHFRVTDLGLQKGNTEVNNENIAKVVTKGKEMMGTAV
jgi:uncharacterized metal-binding protein